MAKRISECAGARVHAAMIKPPERGKKAKISWKVHYKNESVWCNTMEEVVHWLHQITAVQLLGKEAKSWEVDKDGWMKNTEDSDE